MRTCARLLIVIGLLAIPALAAADLIFFEDFEDGTADGFTPIGAGWSVIDGAYNCETWGFEVYSSAVFGDPTWSDYDVSFDIKSVDATSHIFRFRVNDFEDFYDINLRSYPWNDIVVMRTMNTQRVMLAQVPVPTFANNTWHTVDLSAHGFQFNVSLNGSQVLSFHDDEMPERLRGGQCAVVCYSGGVVQHQSVFYDNVAVSTSVVATEAMTLSSVKSLFE